MTNILYALYFKEPKKCLIHPNCTFISSYLTVEKHKILLGTYEQMEWLKGGKNSPLSDCNICSFDNTGCSFDYDFILFDDYLKNQGQMTNLKIIKAIQENDNIIIRHNKEWRYPNQGDDQKSCPMLDFMFQIEKVGGTLIFIPDDKEEVC